MRSNHMSAAPTRSSALNRVKREKIGQLADQVRVALNLSTPITYTSLVDAVHRMGGRVVDDARIRFIKDEARIRKMDGRFEIVIDVLKPERRKLFSLAHELGHLFIHMGFGNKARWIVERDYVESYARKGYDEEEFEANEFAAALLMPKKEFTSLVARKQSLQEIASHFGVSADAADTRGKWLGLYKWS